MRIPIMLDDELVTELDRRAGAGRRSAFAAESLARGLEDERRWDGIEPTLGSLPDTGHERDGDPGAWVRRQRRGRTNRSG